MFAALGIIFVVAGAILTFAIDRQADGVDVTATGWILMAGGGLSFLMAALRAAGWPDSTPTDSTHTGVRTERYATDDGRYTVEDSRVA